MTGWRIGYLAAPKSIAQACDKIQGQVTSGTCSIAQKAAVDAITAGPDQTMIDAFKKRRELVYDLLSEIDGLKLNMPEGAFYFFPDVSSFFGKKYKGDPIGNASRSEEHTSELQSLMRISYAVFCLKTKRIFNYKQITTIN